MMPIENVLCSCTEVILCSSFRQFNVNWGKTVIGPWCDEAKRGSLSPLNSDIATFWVSVVRFNSGWLLPRYSPITQPTSHPIPTPPGSSDLGKLSGTHIVMKGLCFAGVFTVLSSLRSGTVQVPENATAKNPRLFSCWDNNLVPG